MVNHYHKKNAFKHLSFCFFKMDDFKKSIEFLFRALEEDVNDRGKDLIFESQVYVSFGRSYRNVEAYEKSKDYYNMSIDLAKENEDVDILVLALNGISETYILTKQWDDAYKKLNEARLLLSSQEKRLFRQNCALLARIKIEIEEYDSDEF